MGLVCVDLDCHKTVAVIDGRRSNRPRPNAEHAPLPRPNLRPVPGNGPGQAPDTPQTTDQDDAPECHTSSDIRTSPHDVVPAPRRHLERLINMAIAVAHGATLGHAC
ncbi:hypothetical protein N657DRAFT_56899 [Parathielavia appendiculata]|uniref:Uncharacterized protein n=1 Tax=Parathielavia appendiculata TaxID=2587402 RepID=A0AAN6Z8P0_9PEZI|nr:hypothetical protein N657DRAFT_56899 [Parathielavia appendiculata]